ncbi:hypothetical protein ACFL16_01950 [Patescibacteria group bacterium]
MNQKTIIIALTILLVISFFRLAYIEKNEHNLNNQLFLYFNNPTDDSIDFTIENYTKNSAVQWILYCGEEKEQENTVNIKNTLTTINPSISCDKGEAKIEASTKKEVRTLYKNTNSM